MTKREEIEDLILKINKAFKSGQFLNYIEHIRFPFYKNLEPDSKIDFDFPLTLFTGQNGSGKSSTLHAIFGAPDGYSTGNFWFSTKVDPIEEGEGSPNCFIYGYKDTEGNISEVLKTRIKKLNNLDYWEPSRPIKKYGMNILAQGKRNPAINKEVRYFDFRAELSAYDKYFYFAPFKNTKTFKSKQDVIRKYSRYLKEIIDDNKAIVLHGKKKNQSPIDIIEKEIHHISKILGKEYFHCKLIRHTLFGSDGLTVFFKTNTQNYSEAFAGRGEFAVVKLVHEVINAPEYSLIILDEPEVSLHPGAQEEIKIFLLSQILTKKLQVVISTHSPKMVEYFPDTAIKLFYQSVTGKFKIKNTCHYIEAFNSIGHDITDGKKVIIVEDIASQILLEKVLDKMGDPYKLIFQVKYYPGGGDEILKKGVTYSEENEKHKFLILDGDKRQEKFNTNNFTSQELNDFRKIETYVNRSTGINFDKLPFRINSSSSGGNINQKISASLRYLDFLFSNLEFLPLNTPEELIWDNEYAASLLSLKNKTFIFSIDNKANIMDFALAFLGDKSHESVLSTLKLFAERFASKGDSNYQAIVGIIDKFHQSRID
jgi:predicted ATPase